MLALKDQAHAVAETEYTDRPPHIQITLIARPDFEAHRTSFPHIAGQVQFRAPHQQGSNYQPCRRAIHGPGFKKSCRLSKACSALRTLGAGDPASMACFQCPEALKSWATPVLVAVQVGEVTLQVGVQVGQALRVPRRDMP